jgi:hypothetical protein
MSAGVVLVVFWMLGGPGLVVVGLVAWLWRRDRIRSARSAVPVVGGEDKQHA